MKDLIILASDGDLKLALEGLLTRHMALGIRPITYKIIVEPEHDPACALRGVQFISNFKEIYDKGLLIFDHEGSGKEQSSRADLQNTLNREFEKIGWKCGHALAIVIEPELENWVWSVSPHVEKVIGWQEDKLCLRDWLIKQQWMGANQSKPLRPKEAFEAALRYAKNPRSASLFKKLAEKVSLRNCADESFCEFMTTMQKWFPADRNP